MHISCSAARMIISPCKKFSDFSKNSEKNCVLLERNWIGTKNQIFFKSGGSKWALPVEKLGDGKLFNFFQKWWDKNWMPGKETRLEQKFSDFFKRSRKKTGHSGKKLGRDKNFWIFFKNSETKTACPGEKLGRDKNFGLFSKSVRVNDTHRERNWMGTQWR